MNQCKSIMLDGDASIFPQYSWTSMEEIHRRFELNGFTLTVYLRPRDYNHSPQVTFNHHEE